MTHTHTENTSESDQVKILALVMAQDKGLDLNWNITATIWGESGLRFDMLLDDRSFFELKKKARVYNSRKALSALKETT